MKNWKQAVLVAVLSMLLLLIFGCGQSVTQKTGEQKTPEEVQTPKAVEDEVENTAPVQPASLSPDLKQAMDNADIAHKAFDSAYRLQKTWFTKVDPATGLLPQYLHPIPNAQEGDPESIPEIWTPMNTAADLFPFLALAAYITDPAAYTGVTKQVFAAEQKLTTTKIGLPANYLLKEKKLMQASTHDQIFNASEYVKDGLISLLEYTEDEDWLTRSKELIDNIYKVGNVGTPHGILPSDDSEINGEMMQTLYRLFYKTGEPKYLEYAQRFGDAYFKIVLPQNNGLPCHAWNFGKNEPYDSKLMLLDHGNEVILGLALVYAMLHEQNPEVAAGYKAPFEKMLKVLSENGRTTDGFFVKVIDTKDLSVIDGDLSDNWGYILCAYYIHYMCHGDETILEPVKKILGNLDTVKEHKWEIGVDGLADAVEGAIYFYNRIPSQKTRNWIVSQVERMYKRQSHTGIVEGTYLDGNFARTILLAALMETNGVRIAPWNNHLYVGSVLEKEVLTVAVRSGKDFSGKLLFDQARWRNFLNLPSNPPRVNEWPVWWAADLESNYTIQLLNEGGQEVTSSIRKGADLIAGLPVNLKAGQLSFYRVTIVQPEEEPAPAEQ